MQVVSLDEDTGRVLVNLPMKKETVNLGEFMMQPVTKSEFDQQSRVLSKLRFWHKVNIDSDRPKVLHFGI